MISPGATIAHALQQRPRHALILDFCSLHEEVEIVLLAHLVMTSALVTAWHATILDNQ